MSRSFDQHYANRLSAHQTWGRSLPMPSPNFLLLVSLVPLVDKNFVSLVDHCPFHHPHVTYPPVAFCQFASDTHFPSEVCDSHCHEPVPGGSLNQCTLPSMDT